MIQLSLYKVRRVVIGPMDTLPISQTQTRRLMVIDEDDNVFSLVLFAADDKQDLMLNLMPVGSEDAMPVSLSDVQDEIDAGNYTRMG